MRLAAALRRRRGCRGEVELYFAFDDAESAYALIELAALVDGRDVDLIIRPVTRRGIADDPAVQAKREYALTDARRLFARGSVTMMRQEPLLPEDTEFLAEWVAGVPQSPGALEFSLRAARLIWLEGRKPDEGELSALWHEHFGSPPQPSPGAVRENERLMSRRRMYETPAAWLAGRWYFAHERTGQIAEWLDRLGWARR